jgi:soluble lytic murein transglycosylase-like protein
MTRAILMLAALLLAWAWSYAHAEAGECDAPARNAEQTLGIPSNLLAAIGRVESGRRDTTGAIAPWPWSVNAAGQGYFLPSAAAAVALVASLQARGVQSIDVGCFQVNLLYHPDAFASLADAFDPALNAIAAGHFLRDLRAAAASWDEAVAHYHSANPSLGEPYMRQVLASWTGGPTMTGPPVSQVAALVRVIVPTSFSVAAALPSGVGLPGGVTRKTWIRVGPRTGGLRLPVVITPAHSAL